MEYTGKHQSKKLIDDYLGSGKELVKAIEEYGKVNFEKEILFVFKTEEEMNAKEAELVTEEYCDSELTYNLCPGGYGGFGYINSTGKNWMHNNRENSNKNIHIAKSRFVELLSSNSEFKENYSNKMSISKLQYYETHKSSWLGQSQSQDHKDKIGLANSISQLGPRNSQYGSMWITDGVVNKKIKKDSELPFGFRRGRNI